MRRVVAGATTCVEGHDFRGAHLGDARACEQSLMFFPWPCSSSMHLACMLPVCNSHQGRRPVHGPCHVLQEGASCSQCTEFTFWLELTIILMVAMSTGVA